MARYERVSGREPESRQRITDSQSDTVMIGVSRRFTAPGEQEEFMHTVARRAYVAVLLLIFSLAWIPLQAFAQLACVPGLTCPPDTTPPMVRIASPASGATVSGTITVTADASDNVGVAGVQFKHNGINFDTEQISPP